MLLAEPAIVVGDRRSMRERIDKALDACEEINLTKPGPAPRWVLDLVADLQAGIGSLLWVPTNTVEAHAELLDLQAPYLSTPHGETLHETQELLAQTRRELRRARDQLEARKVEPARVRADQQNAKALDQMREQLEAAQRDLRRTRAELETARGEAGQVVQLRDQLAAAKSALEDARDELAIRDQRCRCGTSISPLQRAVARARRLGPLGFDRDVHEIAAAAGVTVEALRSRDRRPGMVELRRTVAMYLRERGCSLPEIGDVIGRDHTTVLQLLRAHGRPEVQVMAS
jgi:hypothetical protein